MSAITESNIVALESNKWVGDVYVMSSNLQVHTMHPNYGGKKSKMKFPSPFKEYEYAILWGKKGAKEVSTLPAWWKMAPIKA